VTELVHPLGSAAFARTVAASIAVALATVLALPGPAPAAAPSGPTVEKGFTIQKLASPPTGTTNCDDLAYLDGHLFMTCQNVTQSTGGGGNSTILEFADDGTIVNTWSLVDKADGIGADPMNHRLIVTLNEDAHTHLATITPSAPPGSQVVNYKYSVDPASPTLTGPLHTGGGTDSVILDSRGHIYIAASYGIAKTGTATFNVSLTPPAKPGATGTATLAPTFLDNATATNGNTGSGTVTTKLIDVDSNGIVPYTSPRYGGDYVITDQTALALVFSSNIDAGTGLTELKLPFGLDDIRWATTDHGTLYIVDKGPSTSHPATNGISALYKVTGPFVAGTAYAASDSIPDQVVTVALANGKLTPFVRHLQTAKGLVYVDAGGGVSALPLAASSATGTGSSAPATAAALAAASTKEPSDGDTLPIVLAGVAIALAALFGIYALTRRRPTTT
jgi:hypothetical protein